jgi:hypothetical protein
VRYANPFLHSDGAHGECERSTGDAYSSYAPDPTSDIFIHSLICISYKTYDVIFVILYKQKLVYIKWLIYQRVISLETQVGITNQRNK